MQPSLFPAFLLAVCVAGVGHSSAQAAPFADQILSASPYISSVLTKAGYGCGWDYPCSPRPYLRRRSLGRAGEVYIRNNYGTVNVYEGGRRYLHSPEAPRPWAGYEEEVAPPYHRPLDDNCGASPCERECGPACWYRRFKHGYCGHGCDVYRERVRFEGAERIVTYPRPVYERPVYEGPVYERPVFERPPYERGLPPPYKRYGRHEVPLSREGPGPAEVLPRRRFEGPEYPANCANGGC
jgi:hypothetical protein